MKFRILQLAIAISIFIAIQCSSPNRDSADSNTIGEASADINIETAQDTSSLRTLADLFYARDDWEEANQAYTKLISLDSSRGEFFYRKGYCLVKLYRHFESIEFYLKSIELNHRLFDSYESLGVTYAIALNDKEKALYYFRMCQDINPNSERIAKWLDELEDTQDRIEL